MTKTLIVNLEKLNIPKDIINIITEYTNPSILKHTINITNISNRTYCLVALPNGYLAIGTYDNFITILRNNSILVKLHGHNSSVYCLAVLPDGNLVSGSDDRTIKIWNNYILLKTLTGHNGGIYFLAVLPNGDFASGSSDKTIKIWRSSTLILLCTLQGHISTIHHLISLPNGDLVSGYLLETSIKIWRKHILVEYYYEEEVD